MALKPAWMCDTHLGAWHTLNHPYSVKGLYCSRCLRTIIERDPVPGQGTWVLPITIIEWL